MLTLAALPGAKPQSGSVFGYGVGDMDFNGELNGDDYFCIDSEILSQGSPL